jgi:hypothetical protein
MSISNSIQKSILHDLTVCQHLHGKFKAEDAEWKPAENMRSTIHLMQYLTYIGKTMTQQFINPPTDHEVARVNYRNDAKWSSENVTFENFSEIIEQEKAEIRETLSGISDADLERMTYHPFSGEESTLFEALTTVTKYVCAYRHQLFLYVKLCGAEVNTLNNWYGMDPAPKAVA